MKRPSFFERLSGTGAASDSFDSFAQDAPIQATPSRGSAKALVSDDESHHDPSTGQLPVDVHQTPSEIVIRAFVAGVRPDELSISISRDMVVIEGSRMEQGEAS